MDNADVTICGNTSVPGTLLNSECGRNVDTLSRKLGGFSVCACACVLCLYAQGSSREHAPDDDDVLLDSGAEDPLQAEYEEAVQGLASRRRAKGARGSVGAEEYESDERHGPLRGRASGASVEDEVSQW
eukprot:503699-Pelagomonas_calceolata.AAC.2